MYACAGGAWQADGKGRCAAYVVLAVERVLDCDKRVDHACGGAAAEQVDDCRATQGEQIQIVLKLGSRDAQLARSRPGRVSVSQTEAQVVLRGTRLLRRLVFPLNRELTIPLVKAALNECGSRRSPSNSRPAARTWSAFARIRHLADAVRLAHGSD